MHTKLVNPDYDRLVQLIYRGASASQPWQETLPVLREWLDAQVVSLVLRPPSAGDEGLILNCIRPEPGQDRGASALADPNDWEVSAYREQFFELDPFVNLPLDKIIALEDLLTDAELMASDYYLHYLEPIGLFRILGVDTGEPGGMLARLRFSRRRDEPKFGDQEKQLLAQLTPHLREALHIFAKLNHVASERDIYAGAVNQLSVATVILDDKARVLNTNAVAAVLLKDSQGLGLKGQYLHVQGHDTNKALHAALASVINAQHAGETSVVRALRVPRPGGRPPLGLVIRPAPASEWRDGQSGPCVTVFISDPDLQGSASQQILGELFGLSPAEANVAILLSRGLSLAEVSEAQHISPHTARAQLKSIFAKTGVSRQAELVRMVIKSVASLA